MLDRLERLPELGSPRLLLGIDVMNVDGTALPESKPGEALLNRLLYSPLAVVNCPAPVLGASPAEGLGPACCAVSGVLAMGEP